MKEMTKKLQDELSRLRAQLDELRVKGNLGKMELRDKLNDYKTSFEPAYQKAKMSLAELARSGADETKTLATSLSAGWEELRKRHRELTEEAERERKAAHDAKRHGSA